eukprot:m.1668975 g.1668975  ORF g.1668975 m.1668975 type:complete len:55 (-) comp155552_c0_seq1:13-177(-)
MRLASHVNPSWWLVPGSCSQIVALRKRGVLSVPWGWSSVGRGGERVLHVVYSRW